MFWSLDAQLAYQRHFPAINWLTSYSLYVDNMSKWFNEKVHEDWMSLRQRLMSLLQDESELNEIVQLVGMDALSAPDRLKLEAALPVREQIGRYKYTATDRIEAEYQSIRQTLDEQLEAEVQASKEEF